MLISRDEAQKIITPDIAGGLACCSGKAFDDWFKEVSDKGRARCTAITKSAFINDHMVSYALEIFRDNKDVKVIRVHGRYQLIIKDTVIFKMKKLNSNFMPSNVPTKTVICYNAQKQPPSFGSQLELMPMSDDITHLINGYTENSLKTKMQPFIVCPNGKKAFWAWPIEFTALEVPIEFNNNDNNDGSSGLNPKPITPKNPTNVSGDIDQTKMMDTKDASSKEI